MYCSQNFVTILRTTGAVRSSDPILSKKHSSTDIVMDINYSQIVIGVGEPVRFASYYYTIT